MLYILSYHGRLFSNTRKEKSHWKNVIYIFEIFFKMRFSFDEFSNLKNHQFRFSDREGESNTIATIIKKNCKMGECKAYSQQP